MQSSARTEFRPVSGVAKFLSVSLLIGMGADSADGLSQLGAFMTGAAAADPKTWNALQWMYAIGEMVFGVVAIVLLIVNAVAVCKWMHRAYFNLKAAQVQGLKHSPGWAVGYWFVPFVNLVKPFLIMKEIWFGSDPQNSNMDIAAQPSPQLMWTWWSCWIGCNFAGQMCFRLGQHETTAQFSEPFGALSNLLSVIAAFCLLQIVRTVSEKQEQLIAIKSRES